MAKKESNLFNMVFTLFLITGIAALALGAVYSLTKDPIAKAKREKLENAIKVVVPEFDKFEEKEIMPVEGKDALKFYTATKDGQIVGTAIETYSDMGFSGRIIIMVGFKPDGTIHNTAVLEHKETPGLGDKMDVAKSDFPLQFMGKNPAEFNMKVSKDGGEVDAITASTISSRAFCDAAKRAYDTYIKEGGNK